MSTVFCSVLAGIFTVAGVIFSVVMLIDCLMRTASDFENPLTEGGKYDKLIWAGAILISLRFFFVGAIVYLLVVKVGRSKSGG
jgi:hypothetical protein